MARVIAGMTLSPDGFVEDGGAAPTPAVRPAALQDTAYMTALPAETGSDSAPA